ncbi:uncharacterized protein LOC132700981 [Cylas formicarius]|uniref:uncharacterized protein LOC132700981 n=1 Tax=Cylas formicarius TaxID=197179 RepID=UPI0029588A69|nr:uncharacterized protein LOC132700981 [Cylas formicarius]
MISPEALRARPRPGGIAKIIDKTQSTRRSSKPFSQFSTIATEGTRNDSIKLSKENKIKTAPKTVPWIFEFEDESYGTLPDAFQTCVDLLAIAISTVMLLAKEYDQIGANHLNWTYSYLSCIQDHRGEYPPNIKRLLNYMKLLFSDTPAFSKDNYEVGEQKKEHVKEVIGRVHKESGTPGQDITSEKLSAPDVIMGEELPTIPPISDTASNKAEKQKKEHDLKVIGRVYKANGTRRREITSEKLSSPDVVMIEELPTITLISDTPAFSKDNYYDVRERKKKDDEKVIGRVHKENGTRRQEIISEKLTTPDFIMYKELPIATNAEKIDIDRMKTNAEYEEKVEIFDKSHRGAEVTDERVERRMLAAVEIGIADEKICAAIKSLEKMTTEQKFTCASLKSVTKFTKSKVNQNVKQTTNL